MQESSMRIPDSGQPDHQIEAYFPIKALKTGVFPVNHQKYHFYSKKFNRP